VLFPPSCGLLLFFPSISGKYQVFPEGKTNKLPIVYEEILPYVCRSGENPLGEDWKILNLFFLSP
jgi:hypothetical protein